MAIVSKKCNEKSLAEQNCTLLLGFATANDEQCKDATGGKQKSH